MSDRFSPVSFRRRGFTLLELLVVIGIIGVLAALLLGAISAVRFRSKVVACTSNYRQWGVAVSLYAHEDRGGRLPSWRMPLGNFRSAGQVSPWMVPLPMGTNLETYGVTLPLWYCPQRPEWAALDQTTFAATHAGRRMINLSDLTALWLTESTNYAAINHSWFVPRPIGNPSVSWPDPALLKTRTREGWPTRLEDPSAATQPILTDFLISYWNEDRTSLELSKGHLLPRVAPHFALGGYTPELGWTRNINLLFVDGHVETRARKQLQWQFEGTGNWVIAY